MPADVRINQLVVDPQQPTADTPFHFWAECSNVGDEGTDPFTVHFELDQADSIDLPVQNVAPQESQWVNWPHDGMSVGDHVILCSLDAGRAVSVNSKFNVRDIPQAPGGVTDYDDDALANAVVNVISERVDHWLILAVQAVDEWGTEATGIVQAKYNDADATVNPAPVFIAVANVFFKDTPIVSTAYGIFSDIYGLVGVIQSSMGEQHLTLAGARTRLLAAIDELKSATGQAFRQETDGHQERLSAALSPDNNDSPLHQIKYGSLDPGYIDSLADWLGVPEPTEPNTTVPIKQAMTDGFQVVMDDVDRQLSQESQ
jgi:hypothetical protein